MPAWMEDMRAAVEELCGKLDGRALGYKLRHFKRRNFGGRMIDAPPGGKHSCRWRVIQAKDCSGGGHPSDPPVVVVPEGDRGDRRDGSARQQSRADPVDDPATYTELFTRTGVNWPAAVEWLNVKHGTDYPADAKFFEVLKAHRRSILDWLGRQRDQCGSGTG